ncbi:MAG: hypothetical protein Q8K58_13280, partial [Acidimicrobiales bacterium]|nr:hypothetical protein [Acidimicrobiales bacterium]
VFGFRHGFDWDHLAALTDLTGSQPRSRRAMFLATLYALGHALMVLVLGVVAILFAEQVPGSMDSAMERFVGVSLLALGVWIVWTAVRNGGAPPLRSRWMLLIGGVRRLVARRRGAGDALVVIEHAHPHDHDGGLHVHPYPGRVDEVDQIEAVDVREHGSHAVAVQHSHLHRHAAPAPRDPFASYTSRSAFGIGLLHGVGAETPTQVLIFATAANASGRPTSVALLVCFVIGLVVANTLVAAASTLGFRQVLAHRIVAIGLATFTAAFSLVVGALLLFGRSASLPPLPGT